MLPLVEELVDSPGQPQPVQGIQVLLMELVVLIRVRLLLLEMVRFLNHTILIMHIERQVVLQDILVP